LAGWSKGKREGAELLKQLAAGKASTEEHKEGEAGVDADEDAVVVSEQVKARSSETHLFAPIL